MRRINLLFLAAQAMDLEFVCHAREFKKIRERLEASPERDVFKLIKEDAVRPTDLVPHFRRYRPHIVHFSGHGTSTQQIVFVDDQDHSKPVDPNAVLDLFARFRKQVRVVVLNACYSHHQAEGIVQHIDCAIGMDRAIGDEAAIAFAQEFYGALGRGDSVKEAFEDAKVSMRLAGNPTAVEPQLLTKSGVNPAEVFLVQKSAARPPQDQRATDDRDDCRLPSLDRRHDDYAGVTGSGPGATAIQYAKNRGTGDNYSHLSPGT